MVFGVVMMVIERDKATATRMVLIEVLDRAGDDETSASSGRPSIPSYTSKSSKLAAAADWPQSTNSQAVIGQAVVDTAVHQSLLFHFQA
jgi:hypothetical protein